MAARTLSNKHVIYLDEYVIVMGGKSSGNDYYVSIIEMFHILVTVLGQSLLARYLTVHRCSFYPFIRRWMFEFK